MRPYGTNENQNRKQENNMKQLMLGNAAVARGLYEAGCCLLG